MQHVVGDDQVAGRRDRKEFSDPFDQAQHDRIPDAQFGRGPSGTQRGHAERRAEGAEEEEEAGDKGGGENAAHGE